MACVAAKKLGTYYSFLQEFFLEKKKKGITNCGVLSMMCHVNCILSKSSYFMFFSAPTLYTLVFTLVYVTFISASTVLTFVFATTHLTFLSASIVWVCINSFDNCFCAHSLSCLFLYLLLWWLIQHVPIKRLKLWNVLILITLEFIGIVLHFATELATNRALTDNQEG